MSTANNRTQGMTRKRHKRRRRRVTRCGVITLSNLIIFIEVYPHNNSWLANRRRFSYSTVTLWSFSSFKKKGMRGFWLLFVPKAVNGYCVTWLASIFFSFRTKSLWSACLDTGSLRINCLLISYFLSKQGRFVVFRTSYFLSNLQASETCF